MSLDSVLQQIRAAEQEFGRDPGSTTLLAVAKSRSAEEIRTLAQQGQRHIGENYWQEAQPKLDELSDLSLHWHFIGPIQSNKTSAIASRFSWVHSVDRLKIATRLNDQRGDDLPPLNICVQINISNEASKSGLAASALPDFLDQIKSLQRLRVRGLMSLPAPHQEFDRQRTQFRKMRELLEQTNRAGHTLDTLSMGTSRDLRAAIAEGASIVRIGTALFGPRKK